MRSARMPAVRALAHVCAKMTYLMNKRIVLDVLTALRQATAQQHAELDSSTPMALPEPDLRAYHDHLRLLEAWLAAIQLWLDAAGEDAGEHLPAGLARRDYLGLIRADLAHPALAGMPSLALRQGMDWPPLAHSAAYRWGVSYVIEGSQLGGAVLYKRLARQLAPHPLAYLRGEGSPAPRWRCFIAGLRAAVTTPQQIDQACRGARQAFDSLIALLEQLGRLEPLSSSSAEPADRL
jgi:heme oxygenase